MVSRPVNYITYHVLSLDGKKHDVKLYFEASPRWALDQPYQPSESGIYEQGGLIFMKSGSKDQPVLAKSGDDLRIDWGYFYLAGDKKNTTCNVGNAD